MSGEPRNSSRELPFVGRHVRIFAGSWRLPRRGCWDAATERFVAAVECASTTVTEHGYQVVRPRPTPATNHHDSPTGQAPVSRSEPRARGADPGVGAICSVRPSTTTLCCAATGLVPRPMAQSSFPPRVLEGERLMVEPACRPVVWSPEPWGSAADGNARSERPPDLPGWETITDVTLDVDGNQAVQAGHHRGSRPRRPASAARIARRGRTRSTSSTRSPRSRRGGRVSVAAG